MRLGNRAVILGGSEDEVIDEHFARVFNLDESSGDMMRSPRVLAGLLRYRISSALGTKVPFGFDAQPDPPATDWTPPGPDLDSSPVDSAMARAR